MLFDELKDKLIRNILIIDPDEPAKKELSVIFMELRSVDGEINAASVDTLEAASDYLKDNKPYLIIIDPDFAPLKEIVAFIKHNRDFFPIWVLNSNNPHWWETHKEALRKDSFGKRLKTYYYLTKGGPSVEVKGRLLATLAMCNFDFVSRLLEDTTEELLSGDVGVIPMAHVQKMFDKVNKSVLKHLVRALALPDRKDPRNTAFVSMSFKLDQLNRYEYFIVPTLEEAGFFPIMYLNESPDGPIPSDIFDDIGRCSLFIGDITNPSPDVLIEAGAALMKKVPIIWIADKEKYKEKYDEDKAPFLLDKRKIEFYSSDLEIPTLLKAAIERKRKKTATYPNTN